MNKAIIVLDGISEGKTRIIELAKQHPYWIRNINSRNALSYASRLDEAGYDGKTKDENYYTFIEEFEKLADKHFDFTKRYYLNHIKRFNSSEKAQIMFFHNTNKIREYLRDNEEEVGPIYFIYVGKDASQDGYDKCLNILDNNFEEQVLKLLNDLTKNLSEETVEHAS